MHNADRLLTNGRFELPVSARRVIVVPTELRGEPRQVPIVASSNEVIRRCFAKSF